MTIGNSSPLALCTVIMRTPSLSSSRIGASDACALSAATRSSSTKPRNEMPPPIWYWRASSAMCSTLASACSPPVRSANPTCARVAASSSCSVPDTPTRELLSSSDPAPSCRPGPARSSDAGAAAAAARAPRRSAADVRSRPACSRSKTVGIAERVELPRENRRPTCGRSGAPTRAAPRRRSRRTGRAASRTPTAHRRATRSRRVRRESPRPLRVRGTPCRRRARAGCRAPRAPRRRARDVGLPADETPEQETDVLGRDLDRRVAAPLRDLPAALVDDPVDEARRPRSAATARSRSGHVALTRTAPAPAARRAPADRRCAAGDGRSGT